jgi:hypothetical protein
VQQVDWPHILKLFGLIVPADVSGAGWVVFLDREAKSDAAAIEERVDELKRDRERSCASATRHGDEATTLTRWRRSPPDWRMRSSRPRATPPPRRPDLARTRPLATGALAYPQKGICIPLRIRLQ